jgi:hypothetical protein
VSGPTEALASALHGKLSPVASRLREEGWPVTLGLVETVEGRRVFLLAVELDLALSPEQAIFATSLPLVPREETPGGKPGVSQVG